jgi:dihydroflavonol-4-reductase
VRVLLRSGGAIAGCETARGDVLDKDSVARAVHGCDGLYHLAGLVSRDPKDARKMYDLHVGGTRNLLEAAEKAGVKRVVLASSSGTIGVSRTRRVATEEDDYPIEAVGRWPYYLSKIYEEKIALEHARRGLPVLVLNPSLLLGPGDARMSSTQDVFRFLMGRIPVMPRGGISFVDVRDAAKAFVAALSKGNVGERHLLGAANLEFTEFFARLGRIARERGREPDLPASDVEMGECWFFIDSTKSERLLGFRARDPLETLSETVHYVQRNFVAKGA